MAEKTVKVTLVRSLIGTKESHRATVQWPGPSSSEQQFDPLEDTRVGARDDQQGFAYLLKCEG
jgi:large subunit ribosomal protein L30